MNGAFEVGAVALRAQQQALETIANNVANINTPGFKRADVQFAEIVTAPTAPITETERIAREAVSLTGGVRFAARSMVSQPGELKATGAALDFAIEGPGFVELLGPDGTSLLWRGGHLEIDRNGNLAAADGLALRALIAVPDDATNIVIARDGVVSAQVSDGTKMDLGQITLVRPESDADLIHMDSGFYRLTDGARARDAVPGEDGVGALVQGMIESSNVELATAMVEMLLLQRAYSASAQVVQTADQISSITNNLKR